MTTTNLGSGCYNISMAIITVQEIQKDLLGCLNRVEGGETLLIMRDNRPPSGDQAVPTPALELRPFGLCAGEFVVPADFDEPLPESVLRESER